MGFFSGITKVFKKATDFVGDAFDSFTGGTLGKVLDFGSDLVGLGNSAYGLYNAVANNGLQDQKELMAYHAALQNKYWRDQFGSRHQLEVNDLKQAGLNPILSTHSASGVAGVSANASPNETRSQKLMANAQLQNMITQQQLSRSQSAKNLEEAEYAKIRGLNDIRRTDAEIKLMANQGNYYQANSNYLNNEALQWAKTSLPGAGLGMFMRFGPKVLGYLGNSAKSFISGAGNALGNRYGRWSVIHDRNGRPLLVNPDTGQLISSSFSH